MQGRLQVFESPVLNWNVASAVLESDPAGNRKWEKRKSTGRIDGVVSLSMAIGAATNSGIGGEKLKSIYEYDDLWG
jgi:phage terminase large subunit-like protein